MDERFQHLLAINRAIAETLDYEEVLRLVVDKTVQLTGAHACALLLAGGSGTGRVAAWRGIEERHARRRPLGRRRSPGARGQRAAGDLFPRPGRWRAAAVARRRLRQRVRRGGGGAGGGAGGPCPPGR